MTPADDQAFTATKPRPRFAPQIEDVPMRLPAGTTLGSPFAVTVAANGDILVLHQYLKVRQNNASTVKAGSHFLDQGDDPDDPTQLKNVVRLRPDGEFVAAWGGPADAPIVDGVSQWPSGCEGIDCDAEGNFWVFGYLPGDDAVLKYSADGEFLMRIGQRDHSDGEEDTKTLGCPTSCWHDVANREVFFSDGYKNHRVVAFNSDTGEFTRLWGAYGKRPSELSAEEGFGRPVHKVAVGPDGHMYVCDRIKNRIQEFELVPGGARFLREVFIAPGTGYYGSAFDMGFSPDGAFIHVCDGSNNRIWTLDRESLSVLGWASADPAIEGDANQPGIMGLVHRFFVEPSGDILLACPTRGLKRMRCTGVR